MIENGRFQKQLEALDYRHNLTQTSIEHVQGLRDQAVCIELILRISPLFIRKEIEAAFEKNDQSADERKFERYV